MAGPSPPDSERMLLADLSKALESAPRKVQEIEVGIALSIALGKQRPAVSCGGCQNPLEFHGIPARTNVRLGAPFRLIFADA